VERVLDQLPDHAHPGAAQLVLENAAGGGDVLGTTIEELARIAAAIDARGIAAHRVGFCLDTAHLWGAGYDIGEPDVVDALLAEFDHAIGASRLSMIHLNDSRSTLGSHTDRHEHLGAGQIAVAGLGHLLRHPRLRETPFHLETPGMDVGYDEINLQRARDLAAGRALEPMPQEALDLRRSRTKRAHPPSDDAMDGPDRVDRPGNPGKRGRRA
jgi:deoxyribonuclease-4